MRFPAHEFNGGLWIAGGKEQTPKGSMRRNRGINRIKTTSLKSRFGATLLYALTAHSLFRYNDVRFQGVSTALYRAGVSIYSGLNGNRLAFMAMPPQAALFDYLFLAGGGALQKVDTSGNVSNWGIVRPNVDPIAAVGAAGVLSGTYLYKVVFRNRTTGSRSNPNSGTVTVAPVTQQVSLTNIPISSDPQVNGREIYRTNAGGARYFLLTELTDNTTTSYTDNTADASLQSTELQQDNTPPESTYNDCWGPYAGCAWWTRDSTSGAQGRAYYSAIARPEAVRGFIDVSNPDDACQKGLLWGGSNWVFTEKRLYQVLGDAEPFFPREVYGVPGTTAPHSVKASPFGIVYKAFDGIRLFDGNISRLVGFDAIGPILTGESAENLAAFEAVIGEYSRGEYLVSDASTATLGLNLKDGTWRDLGVIATALYQETDTRVIQVCFSSKVVSFEDFGVFTDAGTAITLEWELAGALTDIGQTGLAQRIYIDLNTNGEAITVALVADGTTYSYPPLRTSSRQVVELPMSQNARVLSVRLTGAVSSQVEVFGIETDVYTPEIGASPGRG